MNLRLPYFTLALTILLIGGCTGIPDGMQPVEKFELEKYLGTWYEIARLDHGFERGLEQVTAEYKIRDDGGISVINNGYSTTKQSWETAEGKAYYVDDKSTGHFKVSFFGPFYASYVIFYLDQSDYQYAFVTGYNQDYLWLLSRTPEIDETLMHEFLSQAEEYGFDVSQLILVNQD
jgi:apolipoprotein D and lipocalin family protein